MKKNEEYKVAFQDLTHEGLGVAKINGFPIFVEGALPEEEGTIKVLKVGKSFAYGKLVQLTKVSPHRVDVVNKKGTWTGTMPLQHMTYDYQLMFKQQQVKHVLTKIGKFTNIDVKDTIGAHQTRGYRNKAQIPVRQINGRLATGFFRKNSHEFIEMEDFIIQDPEIDKVIVAVRDILNQYQLTAYNESTHSGNIRHLVVRRAKTTQQIQVVIVTRTEKMEHKEQVVEAIVKECPFVKSIVQNVNIQKTNVILGMTSKVLYGDDAIEDTLCGKKFLISSRSFYQVNHDQTEKLYKVAIEAADLQKTDTVIDAYCGIGTIGLCLADKVEHVYGVEIIEDAIKMAEHNARVNQIKNVTFAAAPAEKMIEQWTTIGATVLFVDPPRKGLDKHFIDTIINKATDIQKIVYVSCNPATLARDLRLFVDGGYDVKLVQPVDMFPYTVHVEALVLMTRE